LALAESSLERLGDALPEGVIVGARGDHYFMHPETKDNADHKAFVEKFKAKTGAQPIYPTYHMAQALFGLKTGYEKAIKDNNGAWPTTEQVAAAMHDITFKAFGRDIHMHRADGQSLEAQLFGVTAKSDQYPFKVMSKMMIVPAELVTPPVGESSFEWIEKNLTPEILISDKLASFKD
jgi:branched-chain amino acid transport system substrate-binding protein